MNNDLISRSALKEKFDEYIKANPNVSGVFELGKFIIDNAPKVELERVKNELNNELNELKPEKPQGEWKISILSYKCSVCEGLSIYNFNFCPNCGADMRGEKE